MYTYQLFTMNAFIIYCKDLLRKKEKITSGIFPEPTDLRGQEILSNIKKKRYTPFNNEISNIKTTRKNLL